MKKILFALITLSAIACAAQAQTRITQTREVSEFNAVVLRMPATVYVTQDNRYSVAVSAPQEWLEKISTETDAGSLEIQLDKSNLEKDFWKRLPEIIITVSLPRVNGLYVESSGTMKTHNNLTTDYLVAEVSGSGALELKEWKAGKYKGGVYGSGSLITLRGISETAEIEVSGSGSARHEGITAYQTSMQLEGSGSIRCNEIAAENSRAVTEGSGSIVILRGVSTHLELSANGSGDIEAADMVAKKAFASVTGSGSVKLSVIETLEAKVAGSGSIYYKGNPSSIIKNISGSGNVRPH
jgi:hypothetical protein